MDIKYLILGSGIAGLGAFKKLKELNENALIVEKSISNGGLLDNFEINGFRFDNAVHLSFAKEDVVRKIFDSTPYYTHPAESRCFDNYSWLRHPVQNNLYPLDVEEKIDLIQSIIDRPSIKEKNYSDWLINQYGNKFAHKYPIRYTRKYWDVDAKLLSTNWIGNRMRKSDLKEVLRGAFIEDTPNTYYTQEMRYPKKGGYKSFIEPLIKEANIINEMNATELDIHKKYVKFDNGTIINYEFLISSIPLPRLVDMVIDAPKKLVYSSNKLIATSIDLISVGFSENIIHDLWFYIYDEDIYASRAYSPSVKSADNVPLGKSSLQFEIYSRGIESNYKKEDLIENTIYAIKKLGYDDTKIEFVSHKHLPFGNVSFDLGMERHRDYIREYFSNQNIYTIGRFGEWDYLWSNQSFISGYNFKKDV